MGNNKQGWLLYKVYYGNTLVYIGRCRNAQQRFRGHFFGARFTRSLDIALVSKIEIAECKTESDRNVYEVWYICKYKPTINKDDKAMDELTIDLPELEWTEWVPANFEKWKIELEGESTPTGYCKKARNKRAIKQMEKDMLIDDLFL